MGVDRAAQLRTHRELFAFACAHGLSMAEARDQLARARWAAADAQRGQRALNDRCGTQAPADGEESGFWWQRGSMA